MVLTVTLILRMQEHCFDLALIEQPLYHRRPTRVKLLSVQPTGVHSQAELIVMTIGSTGVHKARISPLDPHAGVHNTHTSPQDPQVSTGLRQAHSTRWCPQGSHKSTGLAGVHRTCWWSLDPLVSIGPAGVHRTRWCPHNLQHSTAIASAY